MGGRTRAGLFGVLKSWFSETGFDGKFLLIIMEFIHALCVVQVLRTRYRTYKN